MDIKFRTKAIEQYNNWALTDKKKFKKIIKLLDEIKRTPYTGTGKPEALKHKLSGCWSRRIDRINRLVYQIDETEIIILSCEGHYK